MVEDEPNGGFVPEPVQLAVTLKTADEEPFQTHAVALALGIKLVKILPPGELLDSLTAAIATASEAAFINHTALAHTRFFFVTVDDFVTIQGDEFLMRTFWGD